MNTKKLKKYRNRNRNHTKKNKDKKRKNYNGGGITGSISGMSAKLGSNISTGLQNRLSNAATGIKEMPGKEWNKTKMRASAIKNPIKGATQGAIKEIITMENPIVFAYQLIEKYVFGWDVVEPERKMSATQKKIFGDKLEKKNKHTTLKEFVKGEYKKPVETEEERRKREEKEKQEKDDKILLEQMRKIREKQREAEKAAEKPVEKTVVKEEIKETETE
jgi:hypothetical protein